MRKLLLLSALFLVPFAFAEPAADSAAPAPAAELSITDAIILGTIEGVTEYLPISSTGHLIIATHALGLDETATLRGRDGQPLWFKRPSAKHPAGEPLTLKLAADTYTVVIQFGAIAAVALLYWRQIRSMILGLLGRDTAGFHLLRNVLIAFFPAAVVGLAMDKLGLELFSVPAVIAAQIVGAFIIFWAESYRRRRAAPASLELTPRQSLNVGLLQCLSLWPGMSRSMTTIVGGYLAGLDPRRAAEFSFLLGFVTLTAATGYKSLRSGAAMIQVFGVPHVLLGCVIAAVTAAVAVKFLVGWLSRHGMQVFAWYRLAFAALLAAITWL